MWKSLGHSLRVYQDGLDVVCRKLDLPEYVALVRNDVSAGFQAFVRQLVGLFLLFTQRGKLKNNERYEECLININLFL